MEGTGKPEYGKCVEISTNSSIKEMVKPGVLAIAAPVAGFLRGLVLDLSVSPTFILVTIIVNGAAMVVWRAAYAAFEARRV